MGAAFVAFVPFFGSITTANVEGMDCWRRRDHRRIYFKKSPKTRSQSGERESCVLKHGQKMVYIRQIFRR